MASSLNASTSGGGGVIVTSDATGNLDIQSGGSTVVAVTSTGATVTGTLAATGAITGSSTVAGSTGILYPLTSGTAVATTSGTSVDFTSIPSWVKRITFMVSGLSTNGTSNQIVQLGVSGTPTTTGYLSSFVVVLAAPSVVSSTSGFTIVSTGTASGVTQGFATFCLLDASTNKWVYNSSIGRSDSTQVQIGGGVVTLAGTLNLLRLTTINGTDTFDAGSVNILYE